MKNVHDLVESAADLADRGLSKGEIADELNVSRETASWLVNRAGTTAPDGDTDETNGPHDIHVDWNAIGRDSERLWHVGAAMADLLSKAGTAVDLTIGIEKAGTPLATVVGRELDTDLGTYTPRKHQWDDDDMADLGGSFSRNFADIRNRDCYIVDDTITTGTTIGETISAVKERGGTPVACVVLVDKHGLDRVDDVPVHSLVQVIPVGGE